MRLWPWALKNSSSFQAISEKPGEYDGWLWIGTVGGSEALHGGVLPRHRREAAAPGRLPASRMVGLLAMEPRLGKGGFDQSACRGRTPAPSLSGAHRQWRLGSYLYVMLAKLAVLIVLLVIF